jgi:hypothetical protein
MSKKVFNSRKLVSAMNQIDRANRKQAKYNAQQSFIKNMESTQSKFRDHYLLYKTLLIQNLTLKRSFLDDYINLILPQKEIKPKNSFFFILDLRFLAWCRCYSKRF